MWTGESSYRERLGGGRPFYASPVLCEGRLYVPSRRDGVYFTNAKSVALGDVVGKVLNPIKVRGVKFFMISRGHHKFAH